MLKFKSHGNKESTIWKRRKKHGLSLPHAVNVNDKVQMSIIITVAKKYNSKYKNGTSTSTRNACKNGDRGSFKNGPQHRLHEITHQWVWIKPGEKVAAYEQRACTSLSLSALLAEVLTYTIKDEK